jgi:hypothetical protein
MEEEKKKEESCIAIILITIGWLILTFGLLTTVSTIAVEYKDLRKSNISIIDAALPQLVMIILPATICGILAWLCWKMKAGLILLCGTGIYFILKTAAFYFTATS